MTEIIEVGELIEIIEVADVIEVLDLDGGVQGASRYCGNNRGRHRLQQAHRQVLQMLGQLAAVLNLSLKKETKETKAMLL